MAKSKTHQVLIQIKVTVSDDVDDQMVAQFIDGLTSPSRQHVMFPEDKYKSMILLAIGKAKVVVPPSQS